MDLNSLQTTALRLSARLSENLSETARDLGLQGLDAASIAGAGVGSAGKYLEDGAVITEQGVRETKKLLETRREASMAEGLRRVLAMMLKGRPVLTFFPQVVQCLSSSQSSSIQIRSLVSLYILRQARLEPDLALLPVNMYQKDLRDPNPIIRALALRTLAGMGLESIAALVLMSLKTASRDSNWFVRRTAAEALDKIHALDPSHITSLLPILQTLLSDRNALVLGSALAAFETICPDRIDLLHPKYRRICRSLIDADEWSQVVMLRVLEQYARTQFLDPDSHKLDKDLDLLLKCIEPLFFNRNAAVVLAATRLYYHLAPKSYASKYVAPLMRLLQAPAELQAIVLANIAIIATTQPNLFSNQIHRFYVYQSSDLPSVRSSKLQILVLLANKDNIRTMLSELLVYIRADDPDFISEVVRSIGRCAARVPSVQEECQKVLLRLITQGQSGQQVAIQAMQELHSLFRLNTSSSSLTSATKALSQLIVAFHNNRITSPDARAEFYALLADYLPLLKSSIAQVVDVLRVASKTFQKQTYRSKSSLLLLSTKLVLLHSSSQASSNDAFTHTLHLLHPYITTLARYDASWSLRDLARFYSSVLAEAGIKLQEEEEEVAQSAAQEAFAKGEMVDLDSAVQTRQSDKEEKIWQKDMRELLLDTASQSPAAEKGVPKPAAKVESLLGTFRLVSAAQSSNIDTAATSAMQQLAGWTPLPEWPTSAPNHNLREPSADEADSQQQSGRGYPTAFGSSSSTSAKGKSSASRRNGATQSSQSTRAKREQVVLVPTESEPSAYIRQEPRQRDLNDFLASGSEEEESESDEEDSDDSSEEVSVDAAAHQGDEETTDSELGDSEEEESSESEDAGGSAARAARQPLLQNGREG